MAMQATDTAALLVLLNPCPASLQIGAYTAPLIEPFSASGFRGNRTIPRIPPLHGALHSPSLIPQAPCRT